MVRPPGIEPDRVRQGGKACKLNDPRQSKRTPCPNGRPHEKPPRGCRAFGRCALEPSRLPGNLPASGCGVYGDSIALDQKSTGVLPMLLMILFYHIFLALRCNFQISPKFFATSLIKSPCHCFAVRSDTPSFNAAPNTV